MQSYIPIDVVLKMIDDLEIEDIESFFISNKELVKLSNDPRILNHLSAKFKLPPVSSFADLLYLTNFDRFELAEMAFKVDDMEYVKALFPKASITEEALELAANYPKLLEYLLHNDTQFIEYKYILYDIGKSIIDYNNIESMKVITNYIHNDDKILKKWIKRAISDGSVDMAKYLLKNTELYDIDKYIILATRSGNLEIVEYLYKHTDVSPLYLMGIAIEYDYTHIADFIMDNSDKDLMGRWLDIAVVHGELKLFKYILSKYSKIPNKEQIAQWYKNAIQSNYTMLAIYILEKFSDKMDIYKSWELALKARNDKVIDYINSF